jgi:hypothetical protein
MSDSDGDYESDHSDRGQAQSAPRGTRSNGAAQGPRRAAWEDIQRSWDKVLENEDGLGAAVIRASELNKRRRYAYHALQRSSRLTALQATQRYNSLAKRYHSPSYSRAGPLFCHG